MTAGQRLWTALGAAAVLAAAPALAQSTPPPADTPAGNSAADAIGPRELENYSINGTVTRPAEPPAPARRAAATASPPPAARENAAPPTSERATDTRAAPTPTTVAPVREAASARARTTAQPSGSVTVPLPPVDSRVADSAQPEAAAPPDFAPAPDNQPGRSAHGFGIWPWLLAALALAAGGLFLWRGRERHGYAGGPRADSFVAPQDARPVPAPAPRAVAPLPAPAPPPSQPVGIVSTRLRPRIELQFRPLRCVVDDERVLVDFELELFNNGSAAARAVLVEATLFNAGPVQDQAIGAFFANPVGQGERIVAIQPLKRMSVRSQVVAPRANVQLFEVEGRKVFVPLIAFNALYRWSSGDGQTSAAFLVGRDTGGAKLAPLRADLGARAFADLGSRPLPNQVRS